MMETIISGLILATVSGLTFVAYKHPPGYKKIQAVILPVLSISIVGVSIWNLAVGETARALNDFIDASNGLEALAAQRAVELPFGWLFMAFTGCYLYSLFLSNLHQILGSDNDDDRA
jgi:hypothetical protein